MDAETLRVLVQGGAISLALVALGIVFYTIRALLNHLPHIAEVLTGLVAEVRAMREEINEWRKK